jgi:hypothetical protein
MAISEKPAADRRDDGHDDQVRRNPLLHLGACRTTGVRTILVILAIHWLS